MFERAETEWETRPATEWLTAYGRQIDNVRTALDWASSPGGDTELGVALTIAAVPLWRLLSLAEAEPLCTLPHCFCQERLSEMVRIEALAASVRFA